MSELNVDQDTILTTFNAYATPTAPIYSGHLSFSVEKVYPVFWPGNKIAGRFEPEMDVRISLVLIAFYNSNKTRITQGPVIVTEATVVNGKHIFELTIPDHVNGQSLPMSFRDEHVQIEYRLVGYDLSTNEQLRGYLPIQVMTPVFINENDHRVMKIEKKLKTLGLFGKGDIRIGIRVNNPELRPGDDLSMKLVYSGSKKYKLKKIVMILMQRVFYNIGRKSESVCSPKKDTAMNKIKQFFSGTCDEQEMKIPLSISLPPLLPSSPKRVIFGNYIKVEYFIKLKVTSGSYTNAWEIPIHVGTTSQPYTGNGVDIDYAVVNKNESNNNNSIYGVIFNKLSSPWPTDNDTEKLALELARMNSIPGTERSVLSVGTALSQGSIVAPCDVTEGHTQNTMDMSGALTNRSSIHNSLQNYTLLNNSVTSLHNNIKP